MNGERLSIVRWHHERRHPLDVFISRAGAVCAVCREPCGRPRRRLHVEYTPICRRCARELGCLRLDEYLEAIHDAVDLIDTGDLPPAATLVLSRLIVAALAYVLLEADRVGLVRDGLSWRIPDDDASADDHSGPT